MDVSTTGGFGTNKVTVNRNSQIRGAASNLELTTNNQSIKLRYTNATKGYNTYTTKLHRVKMPLTKIVCSWN